MPHSPLFQSVTIVVWLCNDGEVSYDQCEKGRHKNVNIFYILKCMFSTKLQNIRALLYYEEML